MFLAEYRAKEILAAAGIAVPESRLARTPSQAGEAAAQISADRFAVKAQVSAGGRGPAGGVRFAASVDEAFVRTAEMLNQPLITTQTGPEGEIVEAVLIETVIEDFDSIYVALVIDQRTARPALLVSPAGGSDFEERAESEPEVIRVLDLPESGDLESLLPAIEGLFRDLGLRDTAVRNAAKLSVKLVDVFREKDATLLEINPLAITRNDEAIALDAKMIIDGAALFRHPDFEALARDIRIDERERLAQENEINFVRLSGNIGVVANGAGLGLATNDLIAEHGGAPANFMDIRTTATSFQIARGVQILIEDPDVAVLLVNVHGGGMTLCDTIAEGLSFAYARSDRKPPIIYRGAGQNAPWALDILKSRKLGFEEMSSMSMAAKRAVQLAAEA